MGFSIAHFVTESVDWWNLSADRIERIFLYFTQRFLFLWYNSSFLFIFHGLSCLKQTKQNNKKIITTLKTYSQDGDFPSHSGGMSHQL